MTKCVYCGKTCDGDRQVTVKVNSFPVCSEDCKIASEEYIKKDKKYKIILYGAIFFASIGIIIAALSSRMLFAYLAQIIAGGAFVLYPYPISQFRTFESNSIKTVKKLCRVLGVALIAWSIFLLVRLAF